MVGMTDNCEDFQWKLGILLLRPFIARRRSLMARGVSTIKTLCGWNDR